MKRTAALLMAALMALTVCTAIADSPVTPLIVEEIPGVADRPDATGEGCRHSLRRF